MGGLTEQSKEKQTVVLWEVRSGGRTVDPRAGRRGGLTEQSKEKQTVVLREVRSGGRTVDPRGGLTEPLKGMRTVE
jgi:hypothetical protein